MLDDRKFAELEVTARLHAMPPTTPISPEFAAVFLGYSVSSLENMRRDGTGPVYVQAPGEGSKKCRYQIGDLLAWMEKNKVGSIAAAALRDGKVFATLADLQREEAFWIDANGLLCGLVGESTIATVRARLGSHDVVWLPVMDAAIGQWSNVEAHRSVAVSVAAVLKHTMQAVDANLEGTELRAAMTEG